MKFKALVFATFFCLVNSAQAVRCVNSSEWEQEVNGLLQVSHSKVLNDSMVEVSLSMPEEYEGYELVALLIRQKENSEELAIITPYKTVQNSIVKSSLYIKEEKLEYWFAEGHYAKPSEKNQVRSDGCVLRSTINLKNSMKRSQMGHSVEPLTG